MLEAARESVSAGSIETTCRDMIASTRSGSLAVPPCRRASASATSARPSARRMSRSDTMPTSASSCSTGDVPDAPVVAAPDRVGERVVRLERDHRRVHDLLDRAVELVGVRGIAAQVAEGRDEVRLGHDAHQLPVLEHGQRADALLDHVPSRERAALVALDAHHRRAHDLGHGARQGRVVRQVQLRERVTAGAEAQVAVGEHAHDLGAGDDRQVAEAVLLEEQRRLLEGLLRADGHGTAGHEARDQHETLLSYSPRQTGLRLSRKADSASRRSRLGSTRSR
jgi:hypothetical protein